VIALVLVGVTPLYPVPCPFSGSVRNVRVFMRAQRSFFRTHAGAA